jgi:phosphoserine phosphatase RsbU/P
MATGSETKKRASIAASLTLWYIGLTIVNIGIFWVGAGSSQMRLISEKATVAARSTAYEVLRRVQPYIDNVAGQTNLAANFKNSAERFHTMIRSGKPADILSNYRIITSGAEMVYAWPAARTDPTAKEILDSLKALQLKEVKNEMFIGVPDLTRREIDLFIPLTSGGANDLVLISKLPLGEIQSEINGLIRLGIGMVVLLLFLQTGMGVLIYKSFVVPIRTVSSAALRVAAGNFDQVENHRRKDDEINQLIDSFNTMSRDLKKNRDMMQLELDIARKIQAAILPKTMQVGRFLAHIYYNPLQTVSGDYYDFLELADGSIAIFIGDASGHGVPAAFITVMAKVYFTSLVEKIDAPSKLLSVMNERMSSYFSGSGLYLTAFYLRIYPDGRAVYCNALHPDPIILRTGGTTDLLKPTGFYVGMMKKVFREYKDEEIHLAKGDRIVLYTDGLTEALDADAQVFSAERFIETTATHRNVSSTDMMQNTLKEVAAHQAGTPRQDDETLIVIEIGEMGALPDVPVPEVRVPYAFEKAEKYVTAFEKVSALAQDEANLKKILSAARRAMREHNFWKGLAVFSVLNVKKPGETDTLFHIALALYGLKFDTDSEAFLNAALKIDPRFADAHWLRALIAIKAKDKARALASINIALAEKPEDARYLKIQRSLAAKKS